MAHPTLSLLFHYLRERDRRRVVFLPNELYPNRPAFHLELLQGEGNGVIYPLRETEEGDQLLEDEPVRLEDIVSVCLDGFHVNPPNLDTFQPDDQQYIQAEGWAALIALFGSLSRYSLVANHILRRDSFASRYGELSMLSRYGLTVPEFLITSDGGRARKFLQDFEGRVAYRPIAGRDQPFLSWNNDDPSRLERLSLCPVHFEELPEGQFARLSICGQRIHRYPEDLKLPEGISQKVLQICHDHHLHLAEVSLRVFDDEVVVSGLRPFLSSDAFASQALAEDVASLLEEGQLP